MLSKEVLSGLSKQIQHELSACYNYLALAIWFDQEMLKGLGKYFRKQAGEEQEHALRLLDYVLDRGSSVGLEAIEAPKAKFSSVVDALKHAQGMERGNTAAINNLYRTAVKADDLATQNQLQWFINEQVEEEQWADEFVAIAEKVASDPAGLYLFDHRVAKKAEKQD